MSRLSPIIAAALLTALPLPAHAVTIFITDLSGAEEVPVPVVTPGTGDAVLTLSDDQLTLDLDLSWSGLLAPLAAGHIHCCSPVGVNSGVAVGFLGLPFATSGTFSASFDLTLAATFGGGFLAANGGTAAGARAALLAGLFGELAYVNLHTPAFPGGEIRGQLAIPEPAIGGLMLLGVGLLLAARRRR